MNNALLMLHDRKW